MARMVVIFRAPQDVAAFDQHYFEVHLPLAKTLPGLRKYELSRGPITTLNGAGPTHLISTLHFDSLAAIKEAFASPQGQACGADRRLLCLDADVQIFLFDDQQV